METLKTVVKTVKDRIRKDKRTSVTWQVGLCGVLSLLSSLLLISWVSLLFSVENWVNLMKLVIIWLEKANLDVQVKIFMKSCYNYNYVHSTNNMHTI